MLTTTMDFAIPPVWHSAVLQIQTTASEIKPYPIQLNGNRCGYWTGNALSILRLTSDHTIQSLGWSAAETLETHLRLRSFADDWDAPGMEAYDSPPAARDAVAEAFKPKTEFGKRLLALRRAYVANAGPLLDAEAFDRELQQRRGGVSDE